MKYKDDYEAAGVPMMPVVRPLVDVTRQIVFYTWATVATTLLLVPAAGWMYAAVAVGAGVWFIVRAHMLHHGVTKGEKVKPMKLFLLSNNYLAVVFVALSIDAFLNMQPLWAMVSA